MSVLDLTGVKAEMLVPWNDTLDMHFPIPGIVEILAVKSITQTINKSGVYSKFPTASSVPD